jgi:flagellar hook-associated protein 1 FlgK
MMSLNASLEIARRALQAHQLAMSVIGTNIANVNTPGYSRRRADLVAATEIDTGMGIVGTGVEVSNITRARDTVLDRFYRTHSSNVAKWSGIKDYLAKVETLMNEPESGLSEVMSSFWTAWQDLANQPENTAVRTAVQLRGEELCDAFHRLSANLEEMKENVNREVEVLVGRVNSISQRLGQLNRMVVDTEFAGHEASGLRDERDVLIDELSTISSVDVSEQLDGSVTVMMSSQVLVQGDTARQIELAGGSRGGESQRLVWEGTNHSVVIDGGVLEGYVSVRDEYIESYLSDLDTLAESLVTEVNRVHSAGHGLDGSTGNEFFDPAKVTAADISVDSGILGDLNLIAASAGGEIGDGQNALAIANLSTAMLMSDGSGTFDSFYNSLVGRIGHETQDATSAYDTEDLLTIDVEQQRLGVSGVSLDEETSYMLSFQHAYEAMARVTAAIDEMMVTLIDVVGG